MYQKCSKCGANAGMLQKSCPNCFEILEGYCINNMTGKYGYRHADGSFTVIDDEVHPLIKAAQQSVQPTPPLALVCTCETHTTYHASDCPCVNSAGG